MGWKSGTVENVSDGQNPKSSSGTITTNSEAEMGGTSVVSWDCKNKKTKESGFTSITKGQTIQYQVNASDKSMATNIKP